MPWAAKVVLLLAVLLVIPLIGEVAATFILFAASIPLGLIYPLVTKICGALGLRETSRVVYIVLVGIIPLFLAAYFASRSFLQSSPRLKSYYANASILALGTPVILGLAVFQLRKLFVTW